MTRQTAFTAYVGQVERDRDGQIWAVLYSEGHVIAREQARSLRRGKRRVTDMLLSAADATAIPMRSMAAARSLGSGNLASVMRGKRIWCTPRRSPVT